MTLSGEVATEGTDESKAAGTGLTAAIPVDRLHQAMLLFAAGQGEALSAFLQEQGQDQSLWSLAQALATLLSHRERGAPLGGGSAGEEEEPGNMTPLELKRAFFNTFRQHEFASPLRDAALSEDLAAWTKHLTSATIRTCEDLGWKAAAKGQRLQFLPEARNEYLTIDVMAFPSSSASTRWHSLLQPSN